LAGISARELDRLAGKTEGHAAAVETKLHERAQLGTIADYAEVFGVSLDWLVAGEGHVPTEAEVRAAVSFAQQRAPSPAAPANDPPPPSRRKSRRGRVAA